EVPDDLARRGLRQPQRGDQRADADDRSQDGQDDARRAGDEAGDRLARQVARPDAAEHGADPRETGAPHRTSWRTPSTIRTCRRMRSATWSSWVTMTSVMPDAARSAKS